MIHFRGLIAPTEVPTGDGRMFAAGKMTNRPLPIPLMARFGSGGHDGAVPVGVINKIFEGPGGYWCEGDFLDPTIVPEVVKAVYMLSHKAIGPSVDLDRDFTVEAVPHPTRPDKKAGMFKEYNVIGVTLVPMPAFPQVHLSVDTGEEKALLASAGVDFSQLASFDVNVSAWRYWPIAPRDYKFDADDAVKRIAYWAGIGSREPDLDRYASTFLWRNGDQAGDTMAQDSFRLPLADIINNEPHLIYHAVYSAAALLSGAHGGLPNIPDPDKGAMVRVINEIYANLASAFNDKRLKSPFEVGVRPEEMAIGFEEDPLDSSDCGCNNVSEDVTDLQGSTPHNGTVTTMPQTIKVSSGPETYTVAGSDDAVASVNITFTPSGLPLDVLQSMQEEKRPWGADGCHFDADGTCMTHFNEMHGKPYGDVLYADPGYQSDGQHRYPIDRPTHIRAAWAYINMPKNAMRYSPHQLELIKDRIREAARKAGIAIAGADEGMDASEDMMVGMAAATAEKPYGNVPYADPGYQEDGQHRYPIDTPAHIRAAWAYINMPKNADKYDSEDLTRIKDRIKAAAKKHGIEISEDDSQMASLGVQSDNAASLLAGAAPLAPPAAWFSNPGLDGPTKLTIDANGHVFGHLAQWRVCHVGIGNACVLAPKSRMDYSLFRVGTLVCEDGSQVPVGKITLGTGHANAQWGVMPSREHYDNTGWAAAVVNVGEDRHGIWINGALTSTMSPERVAEFRAAALSGDWREVNGNLELIAALAVNNPGFPIYRESNGRAFSLMAVGVIGADETVSGEFSMDSTESTEGTAEETVEPGADARAERLQAVLEAREQLQRQKRFAQLAALDADREKVSTPKTPSRSDFRFDQQYDAEFDQVGDDEE